MVDVSWAPAKDSNDVAIGGIDLAVLLAYLTAVVAIGLWFGRKRQSLADYLLAGRDLPWWAILGSIVATETSTVTFLSVPGVAYSGDMQFLQLAFGYLAGRCLVVVWLLPLYFKGELYSAYQVLDRRFGPATRRTASAIFLVARNLGDGLRLFLTAIMLEKLLGWSMPTCIIAVGLSTIVYTYTGGMRSVVWNDCLQLVVYLAGGAAALALLLQRLPGGWEGLSEFAAEQGKFRIFDFRGGDGDPYSFAAGLIGGMVLTLGTHGADQMMVQRLLSARTQAGAGVALVLSGVVVLLQFALFLLIGVALARFYALWPADPPIARDDEVFATFIVRELPRNVGLVGLVVAAVFAAAMSTVSSSLNSCATALVTDFYRPRKGAAQTPQQMVALSRRMTIAIGLIQLGVGLAAMSMARRVVDEALAIAGFSAGLLLGLFALGTLTRRVGQGAALVGLFVGLTSLLYVRFATSIAWPWYAVIGASVTFLSGLLASLGMGRAPDSPARRSSP